VKGRSNAGETSLFDAPEQAQAYTVSALTRAVGGSLAALGRLRVEGEVGELVHAASGHVYFKLKDEGALVSCAIWRSQRERALRAGELHEGAKVLVQARLDVYPPRGTYSLIVESVEPLGIGALLQRFERLKAELAARGWFERKRSIPAWPMRIGVVTSRDAAAWQDFQKTRDNRWPGFPLRLCAAPVQGAGAARELARALRTLDASGVDVIALVRGGGSLEDLWAFNELPLLEAMRACATPIVTGVGHETDLTLADLVADLRAHTPTDAAQVLVPDRGAALLALERAHAHLSVALDRAFDERVQRLERAGRTRALRAPRVLLDERRAALERAAQRALLAARAAGARRAWSLERSAGALAQASPRAHLLQLGARLAGASARLHARRAHALERAGARLALASRTLEAVSPLAVLGRGYTLTYRAGGGLLRSAAQVRAGDELETRFPDGCVRSRASAPPG
jgi:exodeoxyribonuclease VII large subunit